MLHFCLFHHAKETYKNGKNFYVNPLKCFFFSNFFNLKTPCCYGSSLEDCVEKVLRQPEDELSRASALSPDVVDKGNKQSLTLNLCFYER